MRPLAVVVVDVDPQHPFEVTAVEDQQPVETLAAHRSDEALGDRVRLWRADRRLHDPDPLAAEDLVKRPQRGFSRASRSTSSRISGDSRGRPNLTPGCRHFRRTSD